MPKLFEGVAITPSLLHGDLHPLNAGTSVCVYIRACFVDMFVFFGIRAGAFEEKLGKWTPLLFDPACVYGHAEFDLALGNVVGMVIFILEFVDLKCKRL